MSHPENLSAESDGYFAEEMDYPDMMRRGGLGASARVARRAVYNREARQAIERLLDDEKIDLVHVHSVMHHLTASVILACYERGLPLVWTLHDMKAVCPTTHFLRDGKICEECGGGRFYWAAFYRCKRKNLMASALVATELYLHRNWKIYERADLLIAPSQFLRDKLIEHGIRAKRFEVLPNFVEAVEPPPTSRDDGYVLYVGRLSSEKGIETLVDASGVGGFPLVIVGTGELEAELRDRVERTHLTNIHFLGYRTGADLDSLYRGARVVALPSTCQENCPFAILEAYSYAKPVAGSRLGGIPDIVIEGETGILLPPGQSKLWAEQLGELVDDPTRCRALGTNALGLARDRFSRDIHVARVEQYYGEVLQARGQSAVS
jgi:glycosyltransferase involved in cell wall biosynthesis